MAVSVNVDSVSVKLREKNKLILNSVSIYFQDRVTYLVGPNGAGKSALLHTIMGSPMFQVVKGRIKLVSEVEENSDKQTHKQSKVVDITETSPTERAKLGLFLTWQEPIAIPGLTVYDYLYNLYKYNFDKDAKREEVETKLHAIFDKVNLPTASLHKEINLEFSGGEKKRLEIAAMLLLRPKFIMLDELDSGLDVQSEKHLFGLINDYVLENNAKLVIVSHSFRVRKIIPPQKVVVLVNGRVVKTGEADILRFIEENGYSKFE